LLKIYEKEMLSLKNSDSVSPQSKGKSLLLKEKPSTRFPLIPEKKFQSWWSLSRKAR
jgi:hypothetical protein